MDLRVLGPIEVVDGDDTVPIGGPRQRLVLALLVLNVGETVSTDRLIDGVWGDDPPDAARRTVQAYVSNLRKELEAIRPETLIARSPGYALMMDAASVDARRFEDAVVEGRSLLEANPSAAAATLREALALWRGAPYADLAGAMALRPEITRLEELRRNAVELRIEADLSLGLHGQVIGELETLVAEHPLSERFATQLMLALYRSGRQADALRVAQRTRTVLGEELGIDASPTLRDLEQSILEHSPDLTSPTVPHLASGPVGPDVIRGFEIRRRIGGSDWAETYVAYQRSLEREVAVRVINPRFSNDVEFMGRFRAEISRMIRISHPNIVPFYDTWRDSDGAFIVRRYFPRGSLEDAISSDSWQPDDTPRLVSQIGSALEALHRHGIVHRDVKASDIMIDEASNGYITDFALPMAVFGDEKTYLEHVRADGSPLSDAELLAEPTPQMDIRGLATVARSLLGNSVVPPEAEVVLVRATSLETEAQYATMARFVEAFVAAYGDGDAALSPISHNPYKGLRSFNETDRTDFFGREELVTALIPRLGGPDPGCVALVGASGIGKSSVLNAGLIPALREGALAGSEHWHIVKMHPGSHPYGELADALRQTAANTNPEMLGHLTWGDAGIAEAIGSSSPDTTAETLLVIDQFEELFTLVRDESVRASFITDLVDAAADPDVRLRLVLALRADFYDRPLEYPRLADLLSGCTVTMVPMTAVELERAISEPAIGVGAELDPGLAGRIAAEVEGQPGMLPLVQYAMTDLFERRDGARITTHDYEASGGVRGPLRTRPEAIYRDLSAEGQQAARQVFLHLVSLGEDGQGSRRRVSRSDLTSIVGYEHSVRFVIDAYGDARLLSFDRHPVTRTPTVEIAHDALLREWSRLRGWIDDHRSDVRLHQRLADATADWASSDRDQEFLLVGGLLHRLSGWSKGTDLALSDVEHLYLHESIEISAAGEREETVRIQHEHEIEDRSRRRLRLLAGVWTLTALVAVLAVFAIAQWWRSESLADQAGAVTLAYNLARVSDAERANDPELALLLALSSVEATVKYGLPATHPSEEALHLAMHSASVMYPTVDADVRIISDRLRGLVGVYLLPVSDLVAASRAALTRRFTADECKTYLGGVCPKITIASPVHNTSLSGIDMALGSRTPTTAQGSSSLQGTTVAISGTSTPEWVGGFESATGIAVTSADDATVDIYVQPIGQALAAARRGDALDLGMYLERSSLVDHYGEYPVEVSTMAPDGAWPASEGMIFGVHTPAFLNSMIWYRPEAFRTNGYEIPETWDDLIGLSDQMVDDGLTPWCISSPGGFGGTRLVEILILSAGGMTEYDRWTEHEIPANQPLVADAFGRFGQLVFTPGFVSDPDDVLTRDPVESATVLLDGGCEMFPATSTAPLWAFPDRQDLDGLASAFPFPRIESGIESAVIGSGSVVLAVHDRPEVREFIRYAASVEYSQDTGIPSVDTLSTRMVREALAKGTYRIPGALAMPPQIGSYSYDHREAAYHTAVLRYLEHGPENLDMALRDVEAAWPSAMCQTLRGVVHVTGTSTCANFDGEDTVIGEPITCSGSLSSSEVTGEYEITWNVGVGDGEAEPAWGTVVISNRNGTWEGDIRGAPAGALTQELWGSGDYEGLVYRATATGSDPWAVDGFIEPAC